MAMNGLEKITEKILSEAREEAEKLLSDARSDCARIAAEHAAHAEERRETLRAEAEREGTELVARAKATAASSRKNRLLETQSRLIDSVFDSALAALRAKTPEQYTEMLAGLLSAALLEQNETERISHTLYGEEAMSPDRYEVLLNARDRERCGTAMLEAARKKLGGKLSPEMLGKLKLSDKTLPIDGGLVLRCGDIETNCSLGLLFAQLRSELEGEVSRVLFAPDSRRA